MSKPRLDLKTRTDTDLAAFADKVVRAMTGNPDFPQPPATLAKAADALALYKAGLVDVLVQEKALRGAVALKRQRRRTLERVLTALGAWIEGEAEGDKARIISAGLGVKRGPARLGPLSAPGNLVATPSAMEGGIDLTWERVTGARSYLVECKLNSDSAEWEMVKLVTASKLAVRGLVPGTEYVFRVRAIGAAGPSPWSDIAVRRAS